jgi:trk/ktr system potassium uptake protein
MISRIRTPIFIFNYLGSLLLIFGVLMLLPMIPAIVFDELGNYYEVEAFLLPSALCLLLGFLLQKKIPARVPTVTEGMVITALAWLLASVAGGLVFFIGIHKSFVDAVFEAASGLTTTGITVFEGLDAMPKGILFWRALLQWIGGLGILTFFLAVSFRGGITSATLFGSEGHKIASPRPVPGIFRTIQILWSIYIFFTIAGILLLWLEGITFFDALTHSFTAISTGGFSTHDASIGYFSHFAHGQLIEYTVIFFMLMGGINFLIHFQVLSGDWSAPFRNFEMQWFWGLTGGATLILMVDHWRGSPIK